MIEVRHLTKRYGDHTAVDHLDFTIGENGVYGFLGPNGAGKSTTMNMMTGYLASTEGDVVINGHDICREPEMAKAEIGYLPELPPLYTDMTVWEYLLFAAELKKVPKGEREEQVMQAIFKLDLQEMEYRLIRNLSKGYKQRVGFAQALLGNPGILILDEPTVGLDPKQIIEIRQLIRELGQDHTVILSSHILSEVAEVCDQVLIISHGKLVAQDTTENLLRTQTKDHKLHITVKGERKSVVSALEMLAEPETVSEDKEGLLHLVLKLKNENDIRPEVSRTLVDLDAVIYEMRLEETTLENVFLELTEDKEEENPSEETENDAEEISREASEADPETVPEETAQAAPDQENEAASAGEEEVTDHESDL